MTNKIRINPSERVLEGTLNWENFTCYVCAFFNRRTRTVEKKIRILVQRKIEVISNFDTRHLQNERVYKLNLNNTIRI